MTFDPSLHMMKLPQRKRDDRGNWVTTSEDYLAVKWRLVWFRERFPHGSIVTETVLLDWDKGVCIHRAEIGDGEGGIATGTGTETRKGFEDFVEKSETRSIGRALAALGIGTQFVGEELSEGDHIVDAPVTTTGAASLNGSSKADKSAAAVNLRPSEPVSTNGHTAAPKADESLAHPTESHLAALRNLAITECGEDLEVYEDRIRTTMKIPKQASVNPRLLTKTMSMTAYMEVFAYYRRLEAQLAKGKETPNGATPASPVVASTTPPPTGEGPTAVPSPDGSSSAPEPDPADAAERDRQRLRAEVAAWDLRVTQAEIEHVIQHTPYSRARQLLWQARTKAAAVTPIEAAAD